jgi:8-hydroxy-5-deazaflavin:NADPH oxidoreductase
MTSRTLTIAVLGAGNIGGTLGRKWVAAGHKVAFGVSDSNGSRAQSLRAELGDITIGSLGDVLSTNPDVVVMALPGGAMDATITTYAAQLDGRIIIDATNRMGGGGAMNSFATFREHTPRAHTFRAFNSLGWENFADPLFDGVQADLFYCGPEGEARTAVEQMIADVGLRPVCLGGVDQVGLVDSVASLWFALALGQKKGRHLAFKVLT